MRPCLHLYASTSLANPRMLATWPFSLGVRACRLSPACPPPSVTPGLQPPPPPVLPSFAVCVYLMVAPATLATLTGPLVVMKGTPLYTATHSAVVLKSVWTCGRGTGVSNC